MLKAILFDADNTLYKVVNERAHSVMFDYLTAQTHLDRKQLETSWRAQVKNVLQSNDAQNIEKRSREYSIESMLNHFGVADAKKRKKIVKGALDIFWKCIIEDLQFDANTAVIITELQKRYVLVIASDEYEKYLKLKLNRVFGNWKKYFKFLVACETAGLMKPSEKYIQIALAKLKIAPEEAVVVGDSMMRDIIPAKKLGVFAVHIAGEDSKNHECAADIEIKLLSELAEAIE
ncbi:MAG: HAD family hydrolase [Nanoarchaeota archaeon]|nr:HAD family hydrolase [Nanoarchaeota archaeon]MBU4452166.1 HAD family hydrolase [Nanoarchaeota archaeon]MCG2724206.1 HAD family hydrolase [archaeon]